jgi:tetratricopeptide (TPR) repeat protein
MTELHLTDDQIAALADDSIGEAQRSFLIEHLRQCETCHVAFLETVRYRSMVLADASVFRAPDEAVALAKRLSSERRDAAVARRPRFAPRMGFALAAAAVLVAAAAVWYSGIRPGLRGNDRWFEPLQDAAASASAEGSIVLPGVESVSAMTSPLHRTGFVERNDAISSAITQLARAYREDAEPDVAHWLISGYLATGDVESAGIYAHDARVRFPDDSRFLVLDAIVAYRSSDMDRAERLLQTALGSDPNNGAALLNLALVQYETGRWDSARRTLELVRTQFPDSPLELRASTLISDLLNG